MTLSEWLKNKFGKKSEEVHKVENPPLRLAMSNERIAVTLHSTSKKVQETVAANEVSKCNEEKCTSTELFPDKVIAASPKPQLLRGENEKNEGSGAPPQSKSPIIKQVEKKPDSEVKLKDRMFGIYDQKRKILVTSAKSPEEKSVFKKTDLLKAKSPNDATKVDEVTKVENPKMTINQKIVEIVKPLNEKLSDLEKRASEFGTFSKLLLPTPEIMPKKKKDWKSFMSPKSQSAKEDDGEMFRTKKFDNFMKVDMENLRLIDVPGIGKKIVDNFEKNGVKNVQELCSIYSRQFFDNPTEFGCYIKNRFNVSKVVACQCATAIGLKCEKNKS